MKRMRDFLKRFVKEEDGMEFLQVALIVVAVLTCMGAIIALMNSVSNSLTTAGNQIDSQLAVPAPTGP